MKQTPLPNRELLQQCGDSLEFDLELDYPMQGNAFLRTNIGCAAVRRREIIAHTEKEEAVLARDWHDLAMSRVSDTQFKITLPLVEVGCFEAKAWFLENSAGRPQWVKGENTKIKVEPASEVCANTMYTLFVRQFGPNLAGRTMRQKESESVNLLDEKGYAVIPPSGTFRQVIRNLDLITEKLRSRIIQLLPIHPEPTTYARMGRFGSPFAALDFFNVNPAYAEFDVKATPMEQFVELIDAVHARNARIFIDIPVNHTGWASKVQIDHPDWFVRKEDGTFVSPGAWGVTWADLCKLEYRKPEVHALMAEVFLYWCRKGVDGFRCDAGYMLPYEAWEYIVAKVRTEYPETIFLLEGLGGPVRVTERLLGSAGLNWAYSELFQNYDRHQISNYLPGSISAGYSKGLQVHFSETHDNSRLAARSREYSMMRNALCALFSQNGAFGFTNGVEWFAEAQVNVHDAEPINWGKENNQIDFLRRLQTLLEIHPAFHAGARIELIHTGHENSLALARTSADGSKHLLILVNLDEKSFNGVHWTKKRFDVPTGGFTDLLGGEKIFCENLGDGLRCALPPGKVYCLSTDGTDYDLLNKTLSEHRTVPERILEQRFRTMLLEIITRAEGFGDISRRAGDLGRLAELLRKDPAALCAELFGMDLPPVVNWRDGVDQRRTVMIPEEHLLTIRSQHPFRAEIKDGDTTLSFAESLPLHGGEHFTIIQPVCRKLDANKHLQINLISFEDHHVVRSHGALLLLSAPEYVRFRTLYPGKDTRKNDLYALCTNDLGGMSQVRGAWSMLTSKYDAILAGNCNRAFPVDRSVMFTRCRGWIVYCDYSQELNPACLIRFTAGLDNTVQWLFSVPVGQGKTIQLQLSLEMAHDKNYVQLHFYRPQACDDGETALIDENKVKIILRPDIEDRCNHEVTKAHTGPENAFPAAVRPQSGGFDFNPSGQRNLTMRLSAGTFACQPEWRYMVPLPLEAERGLESHTDLFSPGFFEFHLGGGESATLSAGINLAAPESEPRSANGVELPEIMNPEDAMLRAIKHFVVRRDDSKTVIAGYPWFLDWGRDTLICLRGMIAAGYMTEARDICRQFARFEWQGTIPNVIRGGDVSNRETSDAPLWFFTAVADYIKAAGGDYILDEDCGGRTLRQILVSIGRHYRSGTPNGIIMDPETGLIFSPSHFTWMDTNYPAGTPREGYPVEIQALWHAALQLLAEIDPSGDWAELREEVRKNFEALFYLKDNGYLSDCLHARPGTPARRAAADDACRSNQLFAITLGLVTGHKVQMSILSACEQLIIPGAIRTLADRQVKYPLPVFHLGGLLNDPSWPYWGTYKGDEDTRRKPAYHNGTAWTWPFPSYCEALFMIGGEKCRVRAASLLMSSSEVINSGVPCHTPEILDGDSPHFWRGCGAQAWGITELFRVYKILNLK